MQRFPARFPGANHAWRPANATNAEKATHKTKMALAQQSAVMKIVSNVM